MDNPTSPSDVPPQLTNPPLITPPTSRPRRSWGWIIVSIVLLVLLVCSVLLNFGQAVSLAVSGIGGGFNSGFKSSSTRVAGPRLDEFILEDNGGRSKIASIAVDGIIASATGPSGNTLVQVIQAQLDRAADDKKVKAVILRVDSPGGEVMASDEINKAIVKFQNDSGKPVVCSMGSLAASGGYYIAAPCRYIVANDLTITGSIGVIMHGYNYRGLMDKVGVLPMTYKSGKYKDMLSPDRSTNEIPEGERAMVQALIDETYGRFTNIVFTGRSQAHQLNGTEGKALVDNWASFADGRVLSGSQALKLGFVDKLGDFNEAVARAKAIAHVTGDANVVEYRERYDIADFLSMFGQSSSAHDVKLDLGLDIPKLRAGCMYFLWQAPEN